MKLKTDLAELEVPKSIETSFREYCKKEGRDPENVPMGNFLTSELHSLTGKIMPREDAEFLSDYYTSTVPGGGGYPVEGRITFEDRGVKYTALAFGWTSKLDEKGPIHMVAYKEQ